MSSTARTHWLIFVAALAGFLVFDTAVYAWIFGGGRFIDLLFEHGSPQEVYLHSVVTALLAVLVYVEYRRERGHLRAAEQLRNSELKFRTIASTALDAIVLLDDHGRVVFWNAAAERMFGYPADEMIGQDVHELLVPIEQRSVSARGVAKFGTSGQGAVVGRTNSFIAVRKDGSRVPVEHTVSSMLLDGRWHALGIMRDVSERQAVLERLELSYAKVDRARREWASVFDAVRDPMFLHDPEGRLIRANAAYLSHAGLSAEEALGRFYWEVFPKGDGPLPNCLRNMRQQGLGSKDEIHVGDSIFYSRAFTVEDESGRFDSAVHVLEDVTEERRIARALHEREARLAAVFDAASQVAFILIDRADRVLEFSAGARQLFGHLPDEVVGRSLSWLDSRLGGQLARPVDTSGESREVELMRADGTPVYVLLSLHAISPMTETDAAAVFVCVDITERKRAESALLHSERRLAEAQRIAHLGNWDWDMAAGTLHWSDEVYRIFGLPSDSSATFEQFLERVHPDERAALRSSVDVAVAQRGPYRFEHRIVRPNGDERVVLEQGEVTYDSAGEPIRMFGTVLDITDRKKAEAQIELLSRMYATLSLVNQVIVHAGSRSDLLRRVCEVIVVNADLQMAWVGELNAEVNAIAPVAYAGEPGSYLDNFPIDLKDDVQRVGPATQALTTGRCLIIDDVATDSRMGLWKEAALERRYRSVAAFPIIESGEPASVLVVYAGHVGFFNPEVVRLFEGLVEDVAYALTSIDERLQRQRTEEALKQAHRKLSLHIEQTPLAVLEIDADRKITQWNRAAERTFGYSRSAILSQSVSKLAPRGTAAERRRAFAELLRSGVSERVVSENVTADGRTVVCEWYNTPVLDEHGDATGLIAIANNITELVESRREIVALNRNLERRVEERTERLQAVNAELEAFSYSVSHDLRAPLRSVDGFSQMLLRRYRDRLDDTGIDYLERVRNAAVRMSQLIDDLLKLSRVTRATLSRQPVDMTTLSRDVGAELERRHPECKVDFTVAGGLTVHADPHLLRIAMVNLLQNAWKFTARNKQAVVAVGRTEYRGRTAFYVRDNGAGFDMRYVDKLFGAFQRLHRDDDYPGTGIGLATVQRIIHRHGGEVWAESCVGKGATFYFTVDRPSPQEDNEDNAQEQTASAG